MRYSLGALALLLAGCSGGGSPIIGIGMAIVGATMIDSRGPVENAVILIAGRKIQAAGSAATVPLPRSIELVDAAGKFVIPAFIKEGGTDPLTELDGLVKGGLLPRYALAAVTAMKAAKLDLEDLGSLEKGKRASLLILAADPLKDPANFHKIERVLIDGTWGDVSKPYAN